MLSTGNSFAPLLRERLLNIFELVENQTREVLECSPSDSLYEDLNSSLLDFKTLVKLIHPVCISDVSGSSVM